MILPPDVLSLALACLRMRQVTEMTYYDTAV